VQSVQINTKTLLKAETITLSRVGVVSQLHPPGVYKWFWPFLMNDSLTPEIVFYAKIPIFGSYPYNIQYSQNR